MLDKYFNYRRRYVAYFEDHVPGRAGLANLAEIARLGFMLVGCALCAGILWIVTVAGFARSGASVGAVLVGACALATSAFALLTVRGLVAAGADRRRVLERSRA